MERLEKYDLAINDALIYDGSGNPAYHGSVGVIDGKIAAISKSRLHATKIVDAQGRALSPGFIDCHTHADQDIMQNPNRIHVLQQGVTCEIGGNCGHSISPVPLDIPEETRRYIDKFYMKGTPSFPSMAAERVVLDTLPLGPHQSYFTGFRMLRSAVIGVKNKRATREDIFRMGEFVAEAMGHGAQGLTSGLQYAPDMYSEPFELQDLGKVAASYGGMYASHMRSEAQQLLECVAETIEVGRQAGLPVHISHLKAAGKTNWNKCDQALRMIEDAVAEGIDVTFDAYPYTAISTNLVTALPNKYIQDGVDVLAAKLRNPAFVKQLRHDIYETNDMDWDNPIVTLGLDKFIIVRAKNTPELIGMTFSQAAKALGMEEFDAVVEILKRNEGSVHDVRFAMEEKNVEKILAHPLCMVGSDGIYMKGDKMCHPRAIGTFPRFLGRYVREKGILSWEEAIRRITSVPAQYYKLHNKGLIKVGYDADLTLFDPDVIIDQADYTDPFKPNLGVSAVFVMGQCAVFENQFLGVCNGRYIPRGK